MEQGFTNRTGAAIRTVLRSALELAKENALVHFIFNAYWEALDFELPPVANEDGSSWRRWIDTFLPVPQDIVPWQEAPLVAEQTYQAGPRSVVILWARAGNGLLAST